jgi:hypothetical protein
VNRRLRTVTLTDGFEYMPTKSRPARAGECGFPGCKLAEKHCGPHAVRVLRAGRPRLLSVKTRERLKRERSFAKEQQQPVSPDSKDCLACAGVRHRLHIYNDRCRRKAPADVAEAIAFINAVAHGTPQSRALRAATRDLAEKMHPDNLDLKSMSGAWQKSSGTFSIWDENEEDADGS